MLFKISLDSTYISAVIFWQKILWFWLFLRHVHLLSDKQMRHGNLQLEQNLFHLVLKFPLPDAYHC